MRSEQFAISDSGLLSRRRAFSLPALASLNNRQVTDNRAPIRTAKLNLLRRRSDDTATTVAGLLQEELVEEGVAGGRAEAVARRHVDVKCQAPIRCEVLKAVFGSALVGF